MSMTRFVVTMCLSWLMAVGAGVVLSQTTSTGSGQAYPSRPIRIIVGEVGGALDISARTIAQGIAPALGQPVIVENRGASLPPELVAGAQPDGYTVLVDGPSFYIGPLLQKMPYDPVKEFAPVSMLMKSPNVLVVNPALPAKSVKELLALAKAKPGQLNYGSGGAGSSTHLAAELFNSMAGVNIVRIPFKGAGPAVNALVGGEVQLVFATAGAAVTHIKSGRLRALAITGAEPFAPIPAVPTVTASGVPGFEAVTIHGMYAPAGTPAAVVKRLNQEVVRAISAPDVQAKFMASGMQATSSSPEQYGSTIKTELAKWGKLIKERGIRGE